MDTPRLSGYPIDTGMLLSAQQDRAARRARRLATHPPRRWLTWLVR